MTLFFFFHHVEKTHHLGTATLKKKKKVFGLRSFKFKYFEVGYVGEKTVFFSFTSNFIKKLRSSKTSFDIWKVVYVRVGQL